MTCLYWFSRRKRASPPRRTTDVADEISGIQNTRLYTYKDLQIATENFSPGNKIGEGGFGSVYKGTLKDGTVAAIKVLSADSRQGVREFLTEIKLITDTEHENLVKLHGCCVEGDHRILVYGYLENNSLSQTLLGGSRSSIQFSWPVRCKICIGIARGLSFLHEEVQPHIVHRDIKASNILLDRNLRPKISDFGLAKLFPNNETHISTRVAGTAGYLAPEYALRGQLTRKADVYSYGILLLEIVCGRSNTNRRLPSEEQYLLERVWEMHEKGELEYIVDTSLNGDYDAGEACRFLKIGLICTQVMPKLRPSMSTVLGMLTGAIDVNDEEISKPGLLSELVGIKGANDQKGKAKTSNSASTGTASSSLSEVTTSHATMTFNSIYDRSN
ncbi:cold-responsive protein kinase 1 [Ricinus communis]|uniref:cold-responsive protein kinase 1 n=1 Tax=Ricinus communis TaxID=3988 RepID=UPI0007723192|nr:cold-responsive protein kinase 1 [Ricinus communis]XP_015577935.1 cold-responsive protein kinase 1 [Ricinus communis]XP_025014042.1 cold-responsive protein kinase 1 [Ricinus communis]XP_025014044.1 cold-responsive protein kinase 1 [Ricinus communis]XP_048235462.1 cold-responsive protein kinase 1 [Ricinus communis]|eukprot:XP_002524272.2 cold-responsive protein kinase 1 [Ricinus communis]